MMKALMALLVGGALLAPVSLARADPGAGGDLSYNQSGPFAVRVMRDALCCDRKGNKIDLYLPVAKGVSKRALPVVVWGNGTWALPRKYDFLLSHLASWGMAVVATQDEGTAQGQTMRDALHLLLAQRSLGRFDAGRVAAVGHSQGAGGALKMAASAPGEVRTVIALDLPDRGICRRGDCDDIPQALSPRTSLFLLSGEKDPLSSPKAVGEYYQLARPGALKARASIRGADHNDIQGNPACRFLTIGCRHGVDDFLPFVTAWLAWQLSGQERARKVYVGKDAPFGADARLVGAAIDGVGAR